MIETGSIKEALIEAVIIKAGIIKRAVQSVSTFSVFKTVDGDTLITSSGDTFTVRD